MQSDAIARNALDSLIDRRHVHLAGRHKLGVGEISVEHRAVHRQVRRIDLQDEPRFVDCEIFLVHLTGKRGQI